MHRVLRPPSAAVSADLLDSGLLQQVERVSPGADEDEARIVARRVVTDGRPAGVAIVPAGELGNRVLAAFTLGLMSKPCATVST